MTHAILPHGDLKRTLQRVAIEIRDSHRDVLRALQLDFVEGGLILRGIATRFFGKQFAFHEVQRRCRLPVLANKIVVVDVSVSRP